MEMGKVVCIWVFARDDKIRRDWYAIDPRRQSSTESEMKSGSLIEKMATPNRYHEQIIGFESEMKSGSLIEKMATHNRYHEQIIGFGTAMIDKKLYLIGGINKADRPHLQQEVNTVSIYDTVTSTWTEGPPMKVNRIPLAVVVVDHMIYVFGTVPHPYQLKDIDVDHWVEFYDSSSINGNGEWRTIAGPRFFNPPSLLASRNFAVVRYADEIRFVYNGLRHGPLFFVFNLSSQTWTSSTNIPGPEILPGNFNTNHVMYGDGEFAVWHWEGGIYAWDLSSNKTSLLFRLEDKAKWGWSRDRDSIEYYNSSPMNLLHLGNGLMCIVYWSWTPKYRSRLVCYTFQILDRFRLGETAIRYYSFPNGHYMSKAIALSPEDVGFQTTAKET